MTRLLASYWRVGEDIKQWQAKYGTRVTKRFPFARFNGFCIGSNCQRTLSKIRLFLTHVTLPGLSEWSLAATKPWLLQVYCVWNVMAHAQKSDFVFPRKGRVHLNRQGRQFSRLLAAELCASAVVMLDTPCSEVVWRVLGTQSIHQFPLHFPSRASPCAITFQLFSTNSLTVGTHTTE
jgi:hypothetical protein